MTTSWTALAKIANVKFEKEARAMRELNAQIASNAERRASLDAMRRDALNALRDVHPAHFHSGDVVWQSWVGKNARELNAEAARLRALQDMKRIPLQRAFGEKLACEELAGEMAKKARKAASRSG